MDQQFIWTRKFNKIWASFCDEVPVNANRRHFFRSFPNSFSVKSALDAMEKVLYEIFPETDIQRQNAQKVLELFLKDGLITPVHKVDTIKDEKDVFYRFGKQYSEKFVSRPRRSVSVDDNRKRFNQPRMSIISPDHFNSEPEICAPSTSANTANNSIMNSTESVNEEQQKPNRMEVDAAARRFLQWINQDTNISERQRQKTLKAFKNHYPGVYSEFMCQSRKSPSISSAPQCMFAYQHQHSLPDQPTPLSPSTSHYSIQSDLARSIDELSHQRSLDGSLHNKVRLAEADFNMQLLKKLDSVIDSPLYSELERQRIIKYFKHEFPSVYHHRFNNNGRPLLKKIREFLPRISVSGEVR